MIISYFVACSLMRENFSGYHLNNAREWRIHVLLEEISMADCDQNNGMFSNSILNLQLFQILSDVWFEGLKFWVWHIYLFFQNVRHLHRFLILKTPSCHCRGFFFPSTEFPNLKTLQNIQMKLFSGRNTSKYLLGDFPDNHHSLWSLEGVIS